MQARETFEAARAVDSPLSQAASEAYLPESRTAFSNVQNFKPQQNERMGDDALDHFFKTSLQSDNLYGKKQNPWDKNINEGQKELGNTENDLESALKKLKCGDVEGAKKALKDGLKDSDDGLDFLRKGLKQHEGGGITGGYAEDTIRDGGKEVRQSQKQMQQALELLKKGNNKEATESIETALRDLKNGKTEVKDGSRYLDGKPSLENKDNKDKATFKEFDRGEDHLTQSEKSLKDAIKSLDCKDKDGAIRDLQDSKRELGNGSNDIKDGLRLHTPNNEECGIKKGLDKANNNNHAIDTAIDLIKNGCPEAAKQVLNDAVKRIDDARKQIGNGVDELKPKCEPPKPEPPHCPTEPPKPEPPKPEPPHCPTEPPRPEPPKPEPPKPEPPHCPEPPRPQPPRPEPQPEPHPEPQPRPEPNPDHPHCPGGDHNLPRPGDNTNPQQPGGDNPGDRVIICPPKDAPKPPLNPGEFLVIMINVSREQLGDIGGFLNRLFNGGRGSGSGSSWDNGGSNGGGNGDNGFFPLPFQPPTPPNPFDLVDSLPNPFDLAKKLPNPFDPLDLSNGLIPNPLNPIDSLSKLPNPLDIAKKLPNPMDPLNMTDGLIPNPLNPVDMITKPIEIAKDPTKLITKPIEGLKKLFKKIF